MTQETHLFHDSIAANLRIAKPVATQQELESFAKKRGMLLSAKISIITTVTLLMGFGFFMMARKGIWITCIILAVVWLAHIIYFVFRVKTVAKEEYPAEGKVSVSEKNQ